MQQHTTTQLNYIKRLQARNSLLQQAVDGTRSVLSSLKLELSRLREDVLHMREEAKRQKTAFVSSVRAPELTTSGADITDALSALEHMNRELPSCVDGTDVERDVHAHLADLRNNLNTIANSTLESDAVRCSGLYGGPAATAVRSLAQVLRSKDLYSFTHELETVAATVTAGVASSGTGRLGLATRTFHSWLLEAKHQLTAFGVPATQELADVDAFLSTVHQEAARGQCTQMVSERMGTMRLVQEAEQLLMSCNAHSGTTIPFEGLDALPDTIAELLDHGTDSVAVCALSLLSIEHSATAAQLRRRHHCGLFDKMRAVGARLASVVPVKNQMMATLWRDVETMCEEFCAPASAKKMKKPDLAPVVQRGTSAVSMALVPAGGGSLQQSKGLSRGTTAHDATRPTSTATALPPMEDVSWDAPGTSLPGARPGPSPLFADRDTLQSRGKHLRTPGARSVLSRPTTRSKSNLVLDAIDDAAPSRAATSLGGVRVGTSRGAARSATATAEATYLSPIMANIRPWKTKSRTLGTQTTMSHTGGAPSQTAEVWRFVAEMWDVLPNPSFGLLITSAAGDVRGLSACLGDLLQRTHAVVQRMTTQAERPATVQTISSHGGWEVVYRPDSRPDGGSRPQTQESHYGFSRPPTSDTYLRRPPTADTPSSPTPTPGVHSKPSTPVQQSPSRRRPLVQPLTRPKGNANGPLEINAKSVLSHLASDNLLAESFGAPFRVPAFVKFENL